MQQQYIIIINNKNDVHNNIKPRQKNKMLAKKIHHRRVL